MSNNLLESKIQSMRDTMGGSYLKPSVEKVEKFCEDLKNTPHALDYLTITRGINNQTIENFRLGYDKDKDAISIPVYKRGELINIRYRFINPEGKQKYTQEKGCEVWIYNEDGIDKAQEKGAVLVVEGEFDLMSVWQSGLKAVISPASGKDSYGVWIELLDTIPKVYIAYDNDKPGKQASKEMAERIGTDKCFEVSYPDNIKDANDYFKENSISEFRKLISSARPYFKYKFSGVGDVIESIRIKKDDIIKLRTIPYVEFEEDWLVILSGVSNAGKTSVAMNIANELIGRKIPTLILPFERGVKTVGKRFIQTRYSKTQHELEAFDDSDWDKLVDDASQIPLYFAMPGRDEIKDIIARAKRIFNTKVVIVDHLDYLVRRSSENHNVETSNTLQEFKALAQEHNIIFIIVHHIKKQEGVGSVPKKPKMEDLKGSSSAYQDPEAVIMLSSPGKGLLEVDIVKNKGTMGSRIFDFNVATGVIGEDVTDQQVNSGLDAF